MKRAHESCVVTNDFISVPKKTLSVSALSCEVVFLCHTKTSRITFVSLTQDIFTDMMEYYGGKKLENFGN